MKKRVDGTFVPISDPFHSIVPYVMPKRTEAEVSMTESFDVTDLNLYMAEQNKEEGVHFKLFHAICTALARTIYLRPKMNIFIAGRRFWQRKDILLSFVVKQKFQDSAEETLMTMKVKPDMNFKSISKLILGDVEKVRKESSNDLDKTMKIVGSLPRFILEILFFILRRLEYYGIFPKSLMKGDPNYSTVLLSNLGSIGAGAPYHHLSNYGTCSIMVTIGTMKKQLVNGKERDLVDMTFILDERIADGFYFAKSLRIMHFLLEHPEYLMQNISENVPVEL